MKQLVVLFCVSVCCISTAVGYQGLPLLSLPEPHHLHKRQSQQDQQRRCLEILIDMECSNGLVQEEVDLALRCNMSRTARSSQLACQRNSDGVYCGVTATDFNEVESQCASTPCSSECREGLTSLREELGCCANPNSFYPFLSGEFNSALWSDCNTLSPPECSNNVQLPQTDVDPICDISAFEEESIEIICTHRSFQPALDALIETEGCQPVVQGALDSCRVNGMGERCSYLGGSSRFT